MGSINELKQEADSEEQKPLSEIEQRRQAANKDARSRRERVMSERKSARAQGVGNAEKRARVTEVLEASPGEHREDFAAQVALKARDGDISAMFQYLNFTVPQGEYTKEQVLEMYRQAGEARKRDAREEAHAKAIKEAEKMAHVTESRPVLEAQEQGRSFDYYAKNTLIPAARDGEVRGLWNGILFDIPQGEHSEAELLEIYRGVSTERHEDFLRSPRGIRQAGKYAEKIAKQQGKLNVLIAGMNTLNFSNIGQVLKWCLRVGNAFEPSGDKLSMAAYYRIPGTSIDRAILLSKFAEQGFVPTDPDEKYENFLGKFRSNDRGVVEGVLIGQFLRAIADDKSVTSDFEQEFKSWQRRFRLKRQSGSLATPKDG